MDRQEAVDILKGFIDRWLSVNRQNSLQLLARTVSVPYSTLKRTYKGDSLPILENLLAILSEVSSRREMLFFLKEYHPIYYHLLMDKEIVEDGDALSQEPVTADKHIVPEVKNNDSDLMPFLSNEAAIIVANLAAMSSGVSESSIKFLCGYNGIKALEQLLEAELVYKDDDGRYRFRDGRLNAINFEVSAKIADAYFECMKKIRRGFLFSESESLNQDGVDMVREIITETRNRIREVTHDKKYHGDKPIAVSLITGYLNLPESDPEFLTFLKQETRPRKKHYD